MTKQHPTRTRTLTSMIDLHFPVLQDKGAYVDIGHVEMVCQLMCIVTFRRHLDTKI